MSLISKLTDKLKNVSKETKNRIIALALAGSLTLSSGLGLTGCGFNNPNSDTPNTDDPNSSITNPSGDNEDNDSKYSSILQNVLYGQYYKELLSNDGKNTGFGKSSKYDISYYSNKYKAIPYGFLENEGEDIDSIKDNSRAASSSMFRIGNDLYIECQIENISTTNYYTHYILKYAITDQEIQELDKLFKTLPLSNYRKTYIQAPFYIQELSYQKTPEVLSKAYISSKTIEDLKNDLASSHGGYLQMAHEELDAQYLQISYISCTPTSEIYTNCDTVFLIHRNLSGVGSVSGELKVAPITIDTSGSTITIDNKIVYNGSTDHWYHDIPKYNEFLDNIVDAYYYNCEKTMFENIKNSPYTGNLEDYLTK